MDENTVGGEVKGELAALKKFNIKSFFCFDKLYFPAFARILFIVMCFLIGAVCVVTVIAGIVSLFTIGFFAGIAGIFGAIIFSTLMIVAMRFWFEVVLVAFNINEAVQDIRESVRK